MKYLALILFFVGGVALNAQTVFDKYGGNPSVTNVTISPQMFQMISKFKVNTEDADTQDLIDMIQSLQQFRVMTTQDVSIAQSMEKWVQQELQSTGLTSILNMTEQGINVQFAAIYGEGDAEVKRLVMFVKGLQEFLDKQGNITLDTTTRFDYVLLEIKGDIDLNQISALTNLIDVPGGAYLFNILQISTTSSRVYLLCCDDTSPL